ncbi:MAG: hypothetical protein ACKO2G_00935 [Verrucomicrobiales bacterium]
MRPGKLILWFLCIGITSLSFSCREKQEEKKLSKEEAKAAAFEERKTLIGFANALRALRETSPERSPRESLIAESVRVAAIEDSGLPEDVATVFRAYKASWQELAGAIRTGAGDEQCAALAVKTDAKGNELREAMARRGFLEIGL